MKITKRTRVSDIVPLLTEKRVSQIIEKIDEYPLEKNITDMTIGEFGEIILNEEEYIANMFKPRERAYIVFGRLKNFRRQLKEVMEFIQRFQIKQNADEKAAAVNINFPDMLSNILITTTQFFNLHSFDEAEKIKLCDYLLILQYKATDIQYQRAYSKIMEQKSKQKK